MNKLFYLIIFIVLVSCGKKAGSTSDSNTDTTQTNTTEITSNYPTDSLRGEYIGGFGANTIVISVNYINGKSASGYNIVRGLRRNIKGEVSNQGAYFYFNLKEPGGDPNDGIFRFTIDTATLSLEGSWVAFDSTKIKSRNYKLTRRVYQHQEYEGMDGTWFLNDLKVKFNKDKTGLAEGHWWNEKTEVTEDVEIPFTWIDKKESVLIEWAHNNIFLSSKMEFTREKTEFEEMLISGDYVMYRY